MRLINIFVFAFAGLATSTHGEVLAICGAEAGHAFYGEGGYVPAGKGGWIEDKLSEGRTTLSRNANGQLDLSYTDVTKGTYSSRSEGAEVVLARQSPGETAILVIYPGRTIEIFDYIQSQSGVWKVLHIQSRGPP